MKKIKNMPLGGNKRWKNKMNKLKTLAMTIVLLMMVFPMIQATNTTNLKKDVKVEQETIKVFCKTGLSKNKIVKLIPKSDYEELMQMIKNSRNDFLTILNPQKTGNEVETAFQNVRPLFDKIVQLGLVDKTTEDLVNFYRYLRGRVKYTDRNVNNRRTLGMWNGLPTPLTMNMNCGVFVFADPATGYVLGTNTIISGIAVDLFVSYTTIDPVATADSVGFLGITHEGGPHSGLIIGFLGVLFGALPSGLMWYISAMGVSFYCGFAGICTDD